MIIKCKDNGGFEDTLSTDRLYTVQKIGVNGYLIENDKSQTRWYGFSKFSIKQ